MIFCFYLCDEIRVEPHPSRIKRAMIKAMRYNLSELMKTAWQFVKFNGFTMAAAMKQAWLHFKLKAKMHTGIIKFYFYKVDGSIREAYGTLKESLVPETHSSRVVNATVQTYYDCEKQEWRCYKKANLFKVV